MNKSKPNPGWSRHTSLTSTQIACLSGNHEPEFRVGMALQAVDPEGNDFGEFMCGDQGFIVNETISSPNYDGRRETDAYLYTCQHCKLMFATTKDLSAKTP